MQVRQVVEQRKEDREWLLHPQEPVERPFPVELKDGFAVRRISRETLVCRDVLAGVVAFGGARPEHEAAMNGWACQFAIRVKGVDVGLTNMGPF